MAWLCSEGPAARGPVDPHLVAARSPSLLLRGQAVGATHPYTHVGCVTTNRKVHTSHLDSRLHCQQSKHLREQHPDQETDRGQHRTGC